jgi:hypothetical protein
VAVKIDVYVVTESHMINKKTVDVAETTIRIMLRFASRSLAIE